MRNQECRVLLIEDNAVNFAVVQAGLARVPGCN